MRPKLLDLFCGAGGAGMGYHLAGFDVTGVDIVDMQGVYPFKFVQSDALEYVAKHGHEFDVIHASPPCQFYNGFKKLNESKFGKRYNYPDLIVPTRRALSATGKTYVIENVPGAPLIDPIMLCGEMFGLKVFRHRLFEISIFLLAPPHPSHPRGSTTNSYRGQSAFDHGATHISVCGSNFRFKDGEIAMGINWMRNRRELSQAIPPEYTKWIGLELLRVLRLNKKAPRHCAECAPEGRVLRSK